MAEVKVVVGLNFGDEGKGLVSGCLARDAVEQGKKVLTIFANGASQRCHTHLGQQLHCIGAGNLYGGDTYYHPMFVFDPISVWVTQTSVYIDPSCRVILPCDVLKNRQKEINRGEKRHGSCGMGLFEAVKRSAKSDFCVHAADLKDPYILYKKMKKIEKEYNDIECQDIVYNIDNFMKAVNYVLKNCVITSFSEIASHYDTYIFENGQGLLLSQDNVGDFPHLTPSTTGSGNIRDDIAKLNLPTEVYYVSRAYMTRHGAGPMPTECEKKDINPNIVDKTNEPNEWQGSLRFGYLDTYNLSRRIKKDLSLYKNKVDANIVFTQLNYTQDKLCVGKNKFEEIVKPNFIHSVYGSSREDEMYEYL